MGIEGMSFEIVDAIKFFGALVSTPDVDVEAKKKANGYIVNLLNSLENDVQKLITANSNIKVIRGKI